MATTATPQRRASPRAAIELPLTFARARRHGAPVKARTIDLSVGGARVSCERPLKIDELLAFDLEARSVIVRGECRVLREHVGQTYAIRFERIDGDGAGALARLTGSR